MKIHGIGIGIEQTDEMMTAFMIKMYSRQITMVWNQDWFTLKHDFALQTKN